VCVCVCVCFHNPLFKESFRGVVAPPGDGSHLGFASNANPLLHKHDFTACGLGSGIVGMCLVGA
jgi:hypothetical protein